MNGLDDMREKIDRLKTLGRRPAAIVCSEAGYIELCKWIAVRSYFDDEPPQRPDEWEGLPIVILPFHTGTVLHEVAYRP